MISALLKSLHIASSSDGALEASGPLQRAELSLLAHAKKTYEKSTGRKVTGAPHLVALLGAKSDNGALLPELPALALDKIGAHLDAWAETSLLQIWSGRLNPVARQVMLQKAAKSFGFASRSNASGRQAYLESLVSHSRDKWPTTSMKRDVALAAMLLRKLDGCQAVKQCPRDREVVMRAIEQNGWALKYASPALRGDPELCRLAGQLGSQ